MPRPWAAEIAKGWSRPRAQNSADSSSAFSLSTLFTARITGVLDRRRVLATVASPAVMPTVPSQTNTMRSAVPIAISACWAMDRCSPLASCSQPPVSWTMNDRPFHSASYDTRSRVTPGTSSTTASRRPMILLTSVDLPTLGRPTIATVGRISTPSISVSISSAYSCAIDSQSVSSLHPSSMVSSAGPEGRSKSSESVTVRSLLRWRPVTLRWRPATRRSRRRARSVDRARPRG